MTTPPAASTRDVEAGGVSSVVTRPPTAGSARSRPRTSAEAKLRTTTASTWAAPQRTAGAGSRSEGGAGGELVVDDEHPRSPERRTVEPFRVRVVVVPCALLEQDLDPRAQPGGEVLAQHRPPGVGGDHDVDGKVGRPERHVRADADRADRTGREAGDLRGVGFEDHVLHDARHRVDEREDEPGTEPGPRAQAGAAGVGQVGVDDPGAEPGVGPPEAVEGKTQLEQRIAGPALRGPQDVELVGNTLERSQMERLPVGERHALGAAASPGSGLDHRVGEPCAGADLQQPAGVPLDPHRSPRAGARATSTCESSDGQPAQDRTSTNPASPSIADNASLDGTSWR